MVLIGPTRPIPLATLGSHRLRPADVLHRLDALPPKICNGFDVRRVSSLPINPISLSRVMTPYPLAVLRSLTMREFMTLPSSTPTIGRCSALFPADVSTARKKSFPSGSDHLWVSCACGVRVFTISAVGNRSAVLPTTSETDVITGN